MDEGMPLKTTHDVSQSLQRKLEGKHTSCELDPCVALTSTEGLADVERAYVHVDYEDEHCIHEEHKPMYDNTERQSIRKRVKELLTRQKKEEA